MSDTEKHVPNKTGASGAAWSDAEKVAYLIVLCENDGKIDAKIAETPVPYGRSVVSCKKLLVRLKEKHKNDMQNIKDSKPLSTAADDAGPATPGKPKTPRKRKTKADTEVVDGEESPKKKAGGRKKSSETVAVKEEIKDEVEDENEDEVQV